MAQFQAAQELRVHRHDDRRHAHGDRPHAHGQIQSPADKNPGSYRYGNQVVSRRPNEILNHFLYVARDNSIAPTTSRGSLRTSTIPADSIATSVPAPIAIPTSAVARAGASFTPSSTIATLLPPDRKRFTADALSAGRTSAATSSMSMRRATESATVLESPVIT